jgi:hypothetical protein
MGVVQGGLVHEAGGLDQGAEQTLPDTPGGSAIYAGAACGVDVGLGRSPQHRFKAHGQSARAIGEDGRRAPLREGGPFAVRAFVVDHRIAMRIDPKLRPPGGRIVAGAAQGIGDLSAWRGGGPDGLWLGFLCFEGCGFWRAGRKAGRAQQRQTPGEAFHVVQPAKNALAQSS